MVNKDKDNKLNDGLIQKDQAKRAQMDIMETKKDIEDIEQRNN